MLHKEMTELEKKVEAYHKTLTPLSLEGRCPHCQIAKANGGHNDCDYNDYYGTTGLESHTHTTEEYQILAIPMKQVTNGLKHLEKKYRYPSDSGLGMDIYDTHLIEVGTRLITNGSCDSCQDGLNEEPEDMSQWYDVDTRNHVYTCINGHPFSDDDDICMSCL